MTSGDTLRDFAIKVDHIGGSQGELPVLLWAYLNGQSGKLKTGNYDFGSHTTTAKILNKVVDGDVAEISIALRPIAYEKEATFVTNAGDDRIFVTTLGGQIYLSSGQPDTPWSIFLDIGELMCPADLEGIFSMAFHPQFPTVPYFYIFYVEGPKCKSVVARYMVSLDNPNIADPTSGVKLLSFDAEVAHHGGQVAFGPDGYLWISVGYGTNGGGDPYCYSQRTDTLRGKLLRIDVNQNVNKSPYYGIPVDNPFIGNGDPPDEVFGLGLRVPWRFSFDHKDGRLFLTDVGEADYEELNIVSTGTAEPVNFGWRVKEGPSCFEPPANADACPTTTPLCDDPSLTNPAYSYSHKHGCSITGGYVYRGRKIPALVGKYVFADYCVGDIWVLEEDNSGNWKRRTILETDNFVISFGEDSEGELYVVYGYVKGFGSVYDGQLSVVKIEPAADK